MADRSSPTIWAPSSRPVPRSATSFTAIGLASGMYPAMVVVSMVAAAASKPSAAASRSVRPVRATSREQTLVMAVPTTPAKVA